MNPTFLDSMSWEMAEVYGAITDQILINLARYFPYYKAGKVPKSAFTYQAAMLAQMGQVNADTVRIIRNNLQGADDALQRVLEQAIIDSVKKTEPGLLKAVKAGILKPATTPVVSPNQMRAFQLYYQQASDKLNLVNTVMLESTKQAYQACVSDVVADIELSERINSTYQALDVAAGETITGVSSWNQAMTHAMDKLKDRGITGFVDHAGHQWSAEAYVAMDIRTTVYNTSRAAVWETNQDLGNDLYIVSYHDGARPLCYPWQNKVISSNNNAREITDLYGNVIQVIAQSDTSYGQPAGLFGINCKHYPSPFIPGVSVLYDQSNIPDEKENEKVYNQLQQQRSLERTIREQKRDLLMEKARGADPEKLRAMRAKIQETDDKIDAFCDETGLPRRQNREGVYTKREFPDADKYDVSTFERTQKDAIDKYFSGGGAQTGYKFGTMTPKNVPPITPPVAPVAPTPVTPVPQNVAPQVTPTQQQGGTIDAAQLDANNFPDSFNKKKTKEFVDAVNSTEGTNADVVELFNRIGVQVDGTPYPVTVSYTEDGHAVAEYVYSMGGKRAKLVVKIPKLTDPEYLQQEIGTTAHELGHLFDHINSEKGVMSFTFDNSALPNALQNARPMSDRIKTLIENAVKEGKVAERAAMDAIKADIDAINNEISKTLGTRDYTEYNRLAKQRDKLWKDAAKTASKASRKAHNGVNAIEDIYDAISGGTLRDKTPGLYGHGSRYYGRNPGGVNAATETLANYCSLALAYPELFNLMAEEQPEIWKACADIIKAMLGR